MNLLEAMRYLAALEQHRHFGRAAQACHITQPALSNALRALEAEFGVTIARRGRQYEGLTPEGQKVLATAQRMLHDREVLRQELHALEERPSGNLVVAAVPTAMTIAARFTARLRARHPDITPTLRSLSSAEIESGIESLSLDMAFGYGERARDRPAGIEVHPQYDEHYFLLRRRSDADATGRRRIGAPISWREVAEEPLCMLSREMHNRTIIDASFAAAGVSAQAAIETNSVLPLVLLVLAGDVSSVMPGALVAIALQYPELEALPLIEPEVVTPISLLLSRSSHRSLAQHAAVRLAGDAEWLAHAAAHSGLLHG
jgi:DNA-binding transcriptional LysR family regulator